MMNYGFLALALSLLARSSLSSRVEFQKSEHLQQEPTEDGDEDIQQQPVEDDEEKIDNNDNVTQMTLKCSGDASEPEMSNDTMALLQQSEMDAHVHSSFLEDHEVSAMILNISASAAGKLKSKDYDCTIKEWNEFSDTFKLGQEYSTFNIFRSIPSISKAMCTATQHMDFQDKSVCKEKNVLFMYPWEDHNNAFCVNANVCHRFKNWHDNACSVRMRRINSVTDASIELNAYSDDSLKHVVLGGHGGGWLLHWGEGNSCGSSHFCVNDYTSRSFLRKLSAKMHQHGTIFLDSCLSATNDEDKMRRGLNLASWVAQIVGKGIRVIGSVLSFGKVRVTRFKAWHAVIDVKAEKGVQRTKVSFDAQCPRWASSIRPDQDGDCRCPDSHPVCKTNEGKECPKSKGGKSGKFFLPMCVEEWATVQCRCYQS